MSTTKEMVYRLWRRLDGGNIADDTKYTYRELLGYVRSGIAEGLRQSYYAQRNLEDFKYGDDSVSMSYKAPVEFDELKKLNYVTLTNKTISIAGNRFTDVSSDNPVSAWSVDYIPVRREEVFVRRKQPCIPCVVLCYKENDRLYFFNNDVRETELLVTDRYGIPKDDSQDLSLPLELENAAFEAAFRLVAAPQFPSDRQNDGVPLT